MGPPMPPDADWREAAPTAGPEVLLCLACAQPLPAGAHFCPACLHPQDWMATSLPFESIWAQGWLLGIAATAPPARGRTLVPGLALVALPGLTQAIFTIGLPRPWGWDPVGVASLAAYVLLWWMGPLHVALLLCAVMGRRRRLRGEPPRAPWRPRAALVVTVAVVAPLLPLVPGFPAAEGALRVDGASGLRVGPLTLAVLAQLMAVVAVAWVMARGIARDPGPAAAAAD